MGRGVVGAGRNGSFSRFHGWSSVASHEGFLIHVEEAVGGEEELGPCGEGVGVGFGGVGGGGGGGAETVEEDEGAGGVELGGRGIEEEGPCAGDSGGVVFGGVFLETGGETACDVDGEGVVHEEEGLRGDGGERAGSAVRVHDGEVEGIEDGEGSGATCLDVETAAVGAGGDRVDFVDHAVAWVDDFAAWDDAAGGDIAGDGDGFAAGERVEAAGD